MAEIAKTAGTSDADAVTAGNDKGKTGVTENINAEDVKANSKESTKAKGKKSTAKCSKFEDMRPFIIEIETLKDNAKYKCEINSKNCKAEDIEYEVWCSDSKKEEYKLLQGDKAFIHNFKQQGKYKISFRGKLPGSFIRDGKSYHITDVRQWGDIDWINMDEMFGSYYSGICPGNCKYFNISADDKPNLSRVTSLHEMFYEARKMNAPLEKWDVSNVTDMSKMFCFASSFNQPIEKWDVSNVKDMTMMFLHAKSFNQPLSKKNSLRLALLFAA